MKIKNKILIILAIILASLFVFNIKSSASSAVVDGNNIIVNNNTYFLPDWFFTKEYRLFYNLVGYYPGNYGSYRNCTIIACSDSPLSVSYSNGEHVLTSSSKILCYRDAFSGYSVSYPSNFSTFSSSSTNYKLNYLNYEGNSGTPCTEYYRYDYYSSHDVYDNNSNLVFVGSGSTIPAIVKPAFVTTVEELQTGKIDNLIIKGNDFNNYEKITLSIAEVTRPITDDLQVIYHNKMKSYDLYSTATFNDFTHFVIESSKLNYSFENDKEYVIYMTTGTTFSDTYGYLEPSDEILDVLYFTVGGMTSEEILQDKQDVANNLLEEQHKTSKGIWGTIKEILSYLNPFSENFFAYKLVSLIIDGLKSLFIPSDDFFETFFTEMKDWFSDRLGFLFYPFELVIDILNKILNVNFSEPVFNIPDINEPFTGQKLIGATTYNLNSLLSNSVLENIHNIYLVVVDSIIIFALVNLAKRKFEEVTSK